MNPFVNTIGSHFNQLDLHRIVEDQTDDRPHSFVFVWGQRKKSRLRGNGYA